MSNLGGNSPSADTDKSNNLVGPKGDNSTVPGPEGPVSTVPGPPGNDGIIASVVGGTNTTIDNTDPANPIINVAASSAQNTTKGDIEGYDTGAARIPVGANDEVLTADSTAALGVAWKTPAAGDPLTTKGDVIGFNTDANRIPVGTNDQVLTADSTNAFGVAWKDPAGGGAGTNYTDLPADVGYTMCGEIAKTDSQRTDATISADLVWIDFIYFDGTTSIDQIAVNSATASGGGDLLISLHPILSRLSIGDQVHTGTITVSTSANTKHTATVNWTPTKGWYALTSWAPVALSNIIMVSGSTASGIGRFFPAGSWTKIGEMEVERKAHVVRKTNYDTTPDLSGIDFNDLSIYDSANQEELTAKGTQPFVELRVSA